MGRGEAGVTTAYLGAHSATVEGTGTSRWRQRSGRSWRWSVFMRISSAGVSALEALEGIVISASARYVCGETAYQRCARRSISAPLKLLPIVCTHRVHACRRSAASAR